jgi:hypothetical protein
MQLSHTKEDLQWGQTPDRMRAEKRWNIALQ